MKERIRAIYLDIKLYCFYLRPMAATAPHIRLILWKAAKAVEGVDRASVAGTGLHISEFQILETLLHKGPLPVNTIGEKVLLTSGSMTAAVKRLEKKGLVRRLQDASDRRVFNIHLTRSGVQVIEQAFARHAGNLEQAVSILEPEERNELVRLLKKLGRYAQALNPA